MSLFRSNRLDYSPATLVGRTDDRLPRPLGGRVIWHFFDIPSKKPLCGASDGPWATQPYVLTPSSLFSGTAWCGDCREVMKVA